MRLLPLLRRQAQNARGETAVEHDGSAREGNVAQSDTGRDAFVVGDRVGVQFLRPRKVFYGNVDKRHTCFKFEVLFDDGDRLVVDSRGQNVHLTNSTRETMQGRPSEVLAPHINRSALACLICRDEFAEMPQSAVMIQLACQHAFCNNCITQWCVEKKTCPACRRGFAGLRR